MLINRRRLTYVFSFISMLILSAAFFYVGRLPATVAAFKESIEEEKASRQLLEAYNVMNNTFHFELPDSWYTQEVAYPGGEVLYNMNFISQDKRILGFVQVWKLSKPLKQFIDESKKSAVGVVDFKYFNVKEIMEDNRKGYLVEYSRANQDGEYNKAYEAFIEGPSNRMYRVSFFVPEKEWRNYYKIIFERIIHSIKIQG
ncbi:MAG TPA: PsbP-related protein [Clostridia bacterium]|nr:PsbP-related protein [Clostridia bacterium]